MKLMGDHSGHVNGEYATLYMFYRLRYPGILSDSSVKWGRDYSTLSRVFNTALEFHYTHHSNKISGNISWYSDRFDMYHEAVQQKILQSDLNPLQGLIPAHLDNIFAFLDGTANEICRPGGNDNAQNAFYNGYHHGHFIIWQGVSFPDGMLVIEGPFPGYYTDTMVWRDCNIKNQLEEEMQVRIQNGQPRLKLYADKIYNSSILVTAAWSIRHGEVFPWMIVENSIMSKIRVAVEWTFGTVICLYKFVDFCKGQKLYQSPLTKHYTIACMLANCHTCIYGDQHNEYFNVDPPTIEDYLMQ
jgi:hypothetical protein